MNEQPLYTVTWAEAHQLARTTKFIDWEGNVIDSSKFVSDPLDVFRRYSRTVAKAISNGCDVPKAVRAEYEQNCRNNGLTPEHSKRVAATPPTPLVNKKGKPFSWSYSRLSDFDPQMGGCPARYAANSFYCTVPYVETEAQKWGNRVHEAAEKAIKGEFVKEPDLLSPIQKYINAFVKQRDVGATVLAEQELTLTENMKPTSWFAKDAWFRGKFDVLIEKGNKLNYFDWKSSAKVKDDVDQLKICLAALAIVKPHVTEFTGKLIFTKHETVTAGVTMSRQEAQDVWGETLGRVERMKQAWRSETFSHRPSGLCPWCGIYDTCVYAKRR